MSEQRAAEATVKQGGGGTSRCRKTAIAAITVLLLSGLVVYLMPSMEERAQQRIALLMAEGNHEDALVIADKLLSEEPDNEVMRELALQAARARLDALVVSGDVKAAQGWIHRQLEVKPYLEPLHNEEVRLEAVQAIHLTLNGTRYADVTRPEPLQQLLEHHTTEQAPLVLLRELEGKGASRHTRLWLMETAIERGYTPGDDFFNFYIAELEQGKSDETFFRTLRELLIKHHPEQARTWAEAALDEAGPQAFQNAWRILQEQKGSEKLNDPYYLALYNLIGSFYVEPLERGRAIFTMQSEPYRRAHLIAFFDQLLASYPKFITSKLLRDEVARLRDSLKQAWGL